MSDRELLEDAARAAGVEYEPRYVPPKGTEHQGLQLAEMGGSPSFRYFRFWNPLADDGDRYRLARATGLRIDWQLHRVLAMDGAIYDWTVNGPGDDEAHAIVRAAAEIWRTK